MVLSMDRWVGKVAIVTGASSGIGVAIVKQLVEDGLQVVGLARRLDLIEQHAKNFSGLKGKLHPYKADVTNEKEIIAAINWAETNLGPIHILVNNAGIHHFDISLLDGETQNFRNVFEVNVLGLCTATREAIKSMKKHGIKGHIIHINSVLGHTIPNAPGLNVYGASKYAVTALTETLRNDINRENLQIKITSVSPGLVHSEMSTLNKNITSERKQLFEKLPILNPEDIADGVRYALSTPEHVQVHELTIKPVGEPM